MLPSPHLHHTQWLPVSLWSRITLGNLTLALRPRRLINKSITFPREFMPVTIRVQIVSPHMLVSLFNMSPRMGRLLEKFVSDNRRPRLQIRAHGCDNANCLNVEEEKAPSLHKPLAEQEAYWIVGVRDKANTANNTDGDLQNQRHPPVLLSQVFARYVFNKSIRYSAACSSFMKSLDRNHQWGVLLKDLTKLNTPWGKNHEK